MIAAEIMQEQELEPLDNSSIVLIEYKDHTYTVLDFNDLSYAQKAQEKMESPDPVEIYLTVHAETAADAAMRLNGQLDTALTENGTGCGTWKGTGESGVCGRVCQRSIQGYPYRTDHRGKQRGKSRSHGQSEHGSAWGGLRLF